ncbi:bifunctional adenosylcobinamide kinase/adenosylcobinamide-phosphate guanylyltransferase [Bacillus sp. JJ1533]|uniref:bifunctional adenosylcobinamide kinase/adenosylcobinamide-phosphate guanylyltransferase n=1 Tax=Bacillus sp. JJ1533 TaxID=3122959 RepID=UPI002FFF7EF7
MHFVTGGAFNGKRAWVKQNYLEAKWISSYEGEPLMENLGDLQSSVVVLEGIEMWVKEISSKMTINQAREYLRGVLDGWLEWENMDSNRKIIVIGIDITKGIVPIEKENRNWRDLTGWVYQDLSFRCERVDVIWYGLNHTIKGRGI